MKNGGQPINFVPHQSGDGTVQYDVHTGLTKREYFAALAMQGLLVKGEAIENAAQLSQEELFLSEKKELIRTLGLYQPFATLMLHGKVESRWVKKGKKPPFPLGRYLIYSTKKAYDVAEFKHVSGEFYSDAKSKLYDEAIISEHCTTGLRGFALAVGDLVKVKPLGMGDLAKAFVDVNLTQLRDREEGVDLWEQVIIDEHALWGLWFENVKRIKTVVRLENCFVMRDHE